MKNKSANTKIVLSKETVESFRKIKNSFISEDIVLTYPDYQKDFELVTDASSIAFRAVLS